VPSVGENKEISEVEIAIGVDRYLLEALLLLLEVHPFKGRYGVLGFIMTTEEYVEEMCTGNDAMVVSGFLERSQRELSHLEVAFHFESLTCTQRSPSS